MSQLTHLKNIGNIRQSLLNDQLNTSLVSFFDWGLLNIGNAINVPFPSSGAYGGNQNILRRVDDPNYTDGRVWESFRSNWVWETGVENSSQPISISGLYVNNTFIPNDGTTYKLNYPLGRAVFNTSISTSSTVKLEYSYKFINTYSADSEWFKKIQPDSFRLDNAEFARYGSGVWSTLGQSRVQLPAIIVENVPTRGYQGMQLGGGYYIDQDILFHIFAETTYDRNFLSDVVSYQINKKFVVLDKNKMMDSGVFPLNRNGTPQSGCLMYPTLINDYGKYAAWFADIIPQESENLAPGLFTSVVRARIRVECPDL
jgi:hypothetical protein